MLLMPADLDHTADVQLHACKGLFLLLIFQNVPESRSQAYPLL